LNNTFLLVNKWEKSDDLSVSPIRSGPVESSILKREPSIEDRIRQRLNRASGPKYC
jgi:hypothetical protein